MWMPNSSREPSLPPLLKRSSARSPIPFPRKPICKPSSRFWPLGCSAGEPKMAPPRAMPGEGLAFRCNQSVHT